VARNGRGVIETLREISGLTLVRIKEALEHATLPVKNVAVHFDVNHGQQILKMEELNVKKVSMDQMTSSDAGLESPSEKDAAPAAAVEKVAGESGEALPAQFGHPSISELLQRLEDPTRITKIEKITAGNGRLTVEVKDGDGRTLRCFDIALNAETKKVNIILDVKK
jgi:ribosomal protein L7/L12